MTAAPVARRLLLSATSLELLRRRVLEPGATLPPGFALESTGTPDNAGVGRALSALRREGVLRSGPAGESVHPAVVADLRILAAPELAVTVRAAHPDLEVTSCVAVSGARGAAVLRTGDTAVQLSAFAAVHLAAELARAVPAPATTFEPRQPQEVPLDRLLDLSPVPLRAPATGALHAVVVTGARPDRAAGVVGAVEWVCDRSGWTWLEPLPSRGGRPWVRLVPVVPGDLAVCLAPLVAAAA